MHSNISNEGVWPRYQHASPALPCHLACQSQPTSAAFEQEQEAEQGTWLPTRAIPATEQPLPSPEPARFAPQGHAPSHGRHGMACQLSCERKRWAMWATKLALGFPASLQKFSTASAPKAASPIQIGPPGQSLCTCVARIHEKAQRA